MQKANLITIDLRMANLARANLKECIAGFALFENANLEGADLEDADVYGADFRGAILKGTVMKCYDLDKAILKNSVFDDKTVWPDKFNAILKGAIRV